jgi:carbonic anhydrase/acetyltransferase-like protein (isoleucine patch superfamily)
MNTKYEFTGETKIVKGVTLHRIRALKDFGKIRKGDIGGWIEAERNLSIYNTAWVFGQAQVYSNAFVAEEAIVADKAQIRDNANIYGNASIYNEAQIYGNARLFDEAQIYDCCHVCDYAVVCGSACVSENARITNNAFITGNARITNNAFIMDNEDFFVIQGKLGSYFRYTTFFKDNQNNIFVTCGCFLGTINEFRRAIKEKHGTTSKQARAYQAAADLAEIQLYKNVPTQDI